MGKKRVIKKTEEVTEEKAVAAKPRAASGEPRPSGREFKIGQRLTRGIAHIRATYNNTVITITDDKGDTIAWSSAGALGFYGAKKATPFVAARVAETVVGKVRKTGLEAIEIRVSGVGSGRDSAIRSLANQGLNIISIKDITPLPHNGPRPKKVRRV